MDYHYTFHPKHGRINLIFQLIIPLVIVQFFAMFSGILCAFQSWFPCQSRTTTESGHEYESEYCSYWPKLAAAAVKLSNIFEIYGGFLKNNTKSFSYMGL